MSNTNVTSNGILIYQFVSCTTSQLKSREKLPPLYRPSSMLLRRSLLTSDTPPLLSWKRRISLVIPNSIRMCTATSLSSGICDSTRKSRPSPVRKDQFMKSLERVMDMWLLLTPSMAALLSTRTLLLAAFSQSGRLTPTNSSETVSELK